MSTDWSRLSGAQLRAIDALDFAPPLHETHLRRDHRIRGQTITSLVNMGLVRREYLHDGNAAFAMPFLRLTQLGQSYQCDWRRWRSGAIDKIASLSGTPAANVARSLDRAADK